MAQFALILKNGGLQRARARSTASSLECRVQLKPNSVAEFNRTFEQEILPLLQRQKGFQDAITLVASNGAEAVGISLWEQRADAEAYHRTAYIGAQELLSKVIEGTPKVQTYDVGTSTARKAAAHAGKPDGHWFFFRGRS